MITPLTTRLFGLYKFFILGLIAGLIATMIVIDGGIGFIVFNSILIVYFMFRFYMLIKVGKEAEELKVTISEFLNLRVGKRESIECCKCSDCKECQKKD